MGVEANQQPLTSHRRKVSTIASGFVATSPSWAHTHSMAPHLAALSNCTHCLPNANENSRCFAQHIIPPCLPTFPAKEVALFSGKSRSFVVR